jgi:hypothetical protein
LVEAQKTAGDVLLMSVRFSPEQGYTYSENDLWIHKLAKHVFWVERLKNFFRRLRACGLCQLWVLDFTCAGYEQEGKSQPKQRHSGFDAVDDSPTSERRNDAANERR